MKALLTLVGNLIAWALVLAVIGGVIISIITRNAPTNLPKPLEEHLSADGLNWVGRNLMSRWARIDSCEGHADGNLTIRWHQRIAAPGSSGKQFGNYRAVLHFMEDGKMQDHVVEVTGKNNSFISDSVVPCVNKELLPELSDRYGEVVKHGCSPWVAEYDVIWDSFQRTVIEMQLYDKGDPAFAGLDARPEFSDYMKQPKKPKWADEAETEKPLDDD